MHVHSGQRGRDRDLEGVAQSCDRRQEDERGGGQNGKSIGDPRGDVWLFLEYDQSTLSLPRTSLI
jgi:hypothetical protein